MMKKIYDGDVKEGEQKMANKVSAFAFHVCLSNKNISFFLSALLIVDGYYSVIWCIISELSEESE